MKITTLDIENFRCIQRAHLEPGNGAMLFGLNGAGKSSVLDALHMLLFGWCQHTSRDGKRAETLIRDGAKQARVTAAIQADDGRKLELCLTLNRTGKKKKLIEVTDLETGEVHETTTPDKDSPLWNIMGVDRRYAQVACMPDTFLCSKDLGDLLAETLVGKVDVDELCGRAAGHGAWLREYAKKKGIVIREPRGLFNLGKFAEEDRRDWNREIKQQEAILADLEGAYTPLDGHGNPLEHTALEACQQALDKCRAKQGALEAEMEASRGVDDLAALQAREIELTEQVAVKEALAKQADIDAGTAYEARVDVNTEQNTQVSRRNLLRHELTLLRKALEAIIDSAECPTCKQACGPEVWDSLRQDKQEELCTKEAGAEEIETKWQAAHETLQAAHEAETAAKSKVQGLSAEQHNLRRKLGEVQGQLARFAGVRPMGDIEVDLAAVQEQITKGDKTVVALKDLRRRHECERYIEVHSEEVQHLDWAVTALRDGELLKGSMHDELAAFRDRLNLELSPHGYSVDVQAEGKSMQFLLTCPGQGPRPVALCSTGNRALAAAAVALAFADHGAPVMLDDANHLDYDNRAKLLGRLKERATGTLFVACAWQQQVMADMSPVVAALAPASVYWLDGGAVKPAGAVEAVA